MKRPAPAEFIRRNGRGIFSANPQACQRVAILKSFGCIGQMPAAAGGEKNLHYRVKFEITRTVLQEISKNIPRVAFVTGGLPLGGSSTFLCNLAGELVRRKISVEILSFDNDNPLAMDFARLQVPVFCVRSGIFEDKLKNILWRLEKFQPTVVLANLSAVSFEVFRYLPPGIFRVGIIHSDDSKVYRMVGHYSGHMDLAAVVSKAIQEKLKQSGWNAAPVHYLPLGVPMPGEIRPSNRSEPLQILYLGRLGREQKRVHLFPQIFEQLKSSGIPFHWTIAGDGEEKAFLEQTMKSDSSTQTVSFAGKISYSQVPEILQAHDIYLLASDYEGLPLSLLEAMGAGIVPVVSDLTSGIPEVVDSSTGILVPVNDIGGYARAIVHLHQHRDELEKKSVAARERVKKEFSVEAMTDRWLSVFPKEFPKIGEWPSSWKIKAPLPARHPVYFSPLLRMLRRIAAGFR